MLNWTTWRDQDREGINEIQVEKEMTERILLPFAADDDQRHEMFDLLYEVVNKITTTEKRIEVVHGEDFITIRQVH
jgi:hypothetical protein